MMKQTRKILLILAVITGLFIIQSLSSMNGIPLNLTLLPVYYLGLRKGDLYGSTSGILTGFFEDALSGHMLGPAILSKGIIGSVSSSFPGGFFIWRPFIGVISVFILSFADEAIIFLSLTLFSQQPAPLQDFLMMALFKSAINSPAGGFIRPNE
jgi:rod shape-determining protein MreD